MRYGPEPIGGSVSGLVKSRPSKKCFGSTGRPPTISGNSRFSFDLKWNTHAARAFHHDVLHVGHLDAEARPALLQQRAIGPGHVLGGDRRAVGEFRLRPQIEGDPSLVGRQFDGLRQMAVARVDISSADEVSRLSHTWPTRGAGAGAARQDDPGAGHAIASRCRAG